MARSPEQAVFYYDLGDPECYLAAEQAMHVLPEAPEWEPVLAGAVLGPGAAVVAAEPDVAAFARRAQALGLQPLRWPAVWPPQTRTAMLAATYAKQIGRAVAFSLAAFRQAFAGGRDLGDENTVLIAAAACEMHPAAVLKGISTRSVMTALDAASERARAAGVRELPAVTVGSELFAGAGALRAAARAINEAA